MAPRELSEHPTLQEIKVLQGLRVGQVQLALRLRGQIQVRLDPLVKLAVQVLQDILVSMDTREQLDHLVQLAS